MSQENVEIVRRVYDPAAHHDSDAVLALYDPGVVLDMSRAPYRDRESYAAWEVIEPDVEELIDAGERLISLEATRGRGRASGAAVELHQFGIWTIRDGKVVRVEWLERCEEALEAAGLRE